MSAAVPPGWYRDPAGQGDARYWNGSSWTESVNRGGVVLNVGIDPSQAQLPPVPGTQVSIPPPPSTDRTGSDGSRSLLGVILGVGVVFLIGILMYAIISNDTDSDDTPAPDSPPTEPAPEEPAPEAPAEDG